MCNFWELHAAFFIVVNLLWPLMTIFVRNFQELYAAINGKGEENENLRRNLEEIQSQLRNKERELEETAQRLTQVEEEAVSGREQVKFAQKENCNT